MTAAPIIMDISRLLGRAGHAAPTGIDRVELAYSECLLAEFAERTEFFALHPLGFGGTLGIDSTRRFIESLAARWRYGKAHRQTVLARRRALRRQIVLGNFRPKSAGPKTAAYLLLSHHHLTRPAAITRTLARHGALFIPMLHDLIPSEYPEYARQREAAKHRRRVQTVATLADGVLVPSDAMKGPAMQQFLKAGRPDLPVHSVPHGVDLLAPPCDNTDSETPYFVCLGTIEPRKNQLLLLNIWRRLVQLHGAAAPRLIMIGRRGWENENVIDMIERCPALQGIVEEHGALTDIEVARHIAGARALLFPSFAEGFGLPLAEAMAMGTHVICSDIPVFREIGGATPEYLDPLDGIGWLAAIERCAFEALPRLRPNAPPKSWTNSVHEAIAFVDRIAATRT